MLKSMFKARMSWFDMMMLGFVYGAYGKGETDILIALVIAWAGAATFSGMFYRAIDEAEPTPPKGETE